MPYKTSLLLLAFVCVVLAGNAVHAAPPLQQRQAPPKCDEVAGFHKLDFWVGEWDVFIRGKDDEGYEQKAGTNRIEKILDGCAVMEHWRGAGGSEGKSLFFYTPATDTWKQVWVTGNATRPGGVKEKTLVEEFEEFEESNRVEPVDSVDHASGVEHSGSVDHVGGGVRSVRFQGTIARPDGGTYLDRTTLTSMEEGKVRQVIETSQDGGETWKVGFDAVYVPRRQATD